MTLELEQGLKKSKGDVESVQFPIFYEGASLLEISKEQTALLLKEPENEQINVTGNGFLYVEAVEFRKRLIDVFGVGGHALLIHNMLKVGETACVDGSLLIKGAFVARAVGEARYIELNKNMTWATAIEQARTDCIKRCCKDIGIFSNMWRKQFRIKWFKANVVKVWRLQTGKTDGKIGSFEYRKVDGSKFWDESGEPITADKLPSISKPPISKIEKKEIEQKVTQSEFERLKDLLLRQETRHDLDIWSDRNSDLVAKLPKEQADEIYKMFAQLQKELE